MCSNPEESLAEEFVAGHGSWIREHRLQKRKPNKENEGNYLQEVYLIRRSTAKENTACLLVDQVLCLGKIQVHKNQATTNFRKMKKICAGKKYNLLLATPMNIIFIATICKY